MNILIPVNPVTGNMTRMSFAQGRNCNYEVPGGYADDWDRMSILLYKLFIVNLIDICKLVNFEHLQLHFIITIPCRVLVNCNVMIAVRFCNFV